MAGHFQSTVKNNPAK